MTNKEVWESMSEEQQEAVRFILGAVKKVNDEIPDDDNDDNDEVEHSDDELKHYGVLGMKWGVRRYQNPDGTLTEKGKKRYGEGGQYEYKSRSTKRLERKVSKLSSDVEMAGGFASTKKLAKLEKKTKMLEASKKMDKAYQEYAKTTSTGKAIVQNLIFGPWGARGYQQGRALGYDRVTSAIMGLLSSSDIINNAIVRKAYRESTARWGTPDEAKKAVKDMLTK